MKRVYAADSSIMGMHLENPILESQQFETKEKYTGLGQELGIWEVQNGPGLKDREEKDVASISSTRDRSKMGHSDASQIPSSWPSPVYDSYFFDDQYDPILELGDFSIMHPTFPDITGPSVDLLISNTSDNFASEGCMIEKSSNSKLGTY